MRSAIFPAILLLTSVGCARRETAFQDWKHYLASTPGNGVDAQHAARLIDRLRADDECIAFLWQKAKGPDPEEAVAACSILVAIVYTPTWHDSPQFAALAARIGPTDLRKHLGAMNTSTLSPKWLEIHQKNVECVKKNLRQHHSGGRWTVPPMELLPRDGR